MSIVGKLYQAEFDFEPEARSELGLRSGDKVRILDDKSMDKGWILVAYAHNEEEAGYVPVAYLAPVEEEAESSHSAGKNAEPVESKAPQHPETQASKPHPEPQPDSQDAPMRFSEFNLPSTSDDQARDHSVATNAYPSDAEDTLAIARANAFASRDPDVMDFEPASITNDDFAALFASHEEWFQQAAARRQDAFSELQNAINDLGRRVRDSENRSSNMVQTLSELEQLIDDERHKWQSRLDSDSLLSKTMETSNFPEMSRILDPEKNKEADSSRIQCKLF